MAVGLGRRIKDRVRVFNKHVTNPILGQLAGRRRGPFALVKQRVDWYRNVVAANGCRIVWHAREVVIDGVEPLP